MSDLQIEHPFECPHCGEPISVLLDLSIDTQTYVEDCEVCCCPILIDYTAEDGDLVAFTAERTT